jgi:hypothetical protein
MPQIKTNKPEKFTVRRAELNLSPNGYKMSPMGEKLMKIAMDIQNSDEPGLSEEDIEQRLKMGRGGYDPDDE